MQEKGLRGWSEFHSVPQSLIVLAINGWDEAGCTCVSIPENQYQTT
jgi:hypothetical protein